MIELDMTSMMDINFVGVVGGGRVLAGGFFMTMMSESVESDLPARFSRS